jgi:hypothetical protein
LEETPASPMRIWQLEPRPTNISSGVSSISWFSSEPVRIRNDAMGGGSFEDV